MNTLERLNKIAAIGQQIVDKENEEKRMKQEKIDGYANVIKSLSPHINDLVRLCAALIENKVPYEQFVAESFNHKVGFYINRKSNGIVGIGIVGGGYDGENFAVDVLGDIVVCPDLNSNKKDSFGRNTYSDYCNKCERFIDGFDDFERAVFDYIDNL